MLQADEPDDYVIATGEMHTVREFLRVAFEHAGLGLGADVEIDPRYFRPTEVDALLRRRRARRARSSAGSRRCASSELVELMVDADVARARGRSSPARSRATATSGR